MDPCRRRFDGDVRDEAAFPGAGSEVPTDECRSAQRCTDEYVFAAFYQFRRIVTKLSASPCRHSFLCFTAGFRFFGAQLIPPIMLSGSLGRAPPRSFFNARCDLIFIGRIQRQYVDVNALTYRVTSNANLADNYFQ